MPRIVHFEIPVDDAERAQGFYRSVFDWELQGYGDGGYWLATTGAEGEPGIDGALIQRGEVHRSPVVIVDVPSLDEGLRRATDAGAELVQERLAVPGMGWAAYVRDPEGNVLGLWESDPSAA